MILDECPQCGAAVDIEDDKCKYCKAKYFVSKISHFTSDNSNSISKYIKKYRQLVNKYPDEGAHYLGLGVCFLKIGLHQQAEKHLEICIDKIPEEPNAYYFYALSILNGNRPRKMPEEKLQKILKFINAAQQLNPNNPIYDYFAALVKYDAFRCGNRLVLPPEEAELILDAKIKTCDKMELEFLLNSIGIDDEILQKIMILDITDFEQLYED